MEYFNIITSYFAHFKYVNKSTINKLLLHTTTKNKVTPEIKYTKKINKPKKLYVRLQK